MYAAVEFFFFFFFARLHPTLIDGNGKSASEPGFLVTLQIRPSVSNFARFISELMFGEGKKKNMGLGRGLNAISMQTGPPLKFSTYTSSIDGESRWQPLKRERKVFTVASWRGLEY